MSFTTTAIGEDDLNKEGKDGGERVGKRTLYCDPEGKMSIGISQIHPETGIYQSDYVPVGMGLRMVVSNGHTKVLVRAESKLVVEYIKDMSKASWNTWFILNKIRKLIPHYFDIIHIYREANRAADAIADLHPDVEYLEILPSSFAQDLKMIIHEDKSGKLYDRV
ncbi:hypothetical protein GIB67_001808 [Kingdonia uniflora]|uniref:RNase H type-1 domain-containing protein n=1 Tax=Kingdonia uniflora TaxID=39325 RepID=A0A7J7LBN5_9MAGN|nr:hypothetical protein GIB67_001808 [Kingdonia uniflora]